MSRPRKNWAKYLDLLFRDAALTLRVMPGKGCKPAGYQSAQPAPIRNWWENYGNLVAALRTGEKLDAPKPSQRECALSRAAISRLDFALVLIGGAQLTALQRHLVWDRAAGKMWKQLAFDHDMPIRSLQRQHSYALAEICAYAIARHKKSLAHIRWRKSGQKIVEFRKAA